MSVEDVGTLKAPTTSLAKDAKLAVLNTLKGRRPAPGTSEGSSALSSLRFVGATEVNQRQKRACGIIKT